MSDFEFIDLFAGIGGIRRGFESINGKCIFTSEWNKYSVQTYKSNYIDDKDHEFVGDITQFNEHDIPDHDVLLAGFPCQPFSIAGVSKNNSLGRPHGFECATQGTLFFDVARILAEKKPSAFMLENVKNLVSHDEGRTFQTIKHILEKELKYNIQYRVIDAQNFVPQHRERIIIVGFKEKNDFTFDDFKFPDNNPKLNTILHTEDGTEKAEYPYTLGEMAEINPKYTLSKKLWEYLQDYSERQKKKGNGFGYGLCTKDDVARTISARYYKDGSEILISRGDNEIPRKLTPRECARLMGYEDTFKIPVSDTQAYKQFGNTVVVPVIKEVARIMKPYL